MRREPNCSLHAAFFFNSVTRKFFSFLGGAGGLVAGGFGLVALLSTAQGALSPDQLTKLPAPASARVDFARDIQPIFEASCVQCHARGKSKGSFSLETREDFLEGGDTGVAAVAGKSAASFVIETISGLNPDIVMPQKGKKLTTEQVALFRAWIDQGANWPQEINFFKHEPANLRARPQVTPPVKPGFENPIDRFVDDYLAKNKQPWGTPVDDRLFARRVWLDTLGLLPVPAEVDAFVADRLPDKRGRLVRRLLADNQRYAEHWLTFWNDLLRNDYKGTGYIDGGRKPITTWLYTALARNLPYDQFVAQLVNPNAEAEGFTGGILWRGAVNASMVRPMQAAQGVAQVFLGVNLKCASCHDSFINEYTLADSYGLASIYAEGPLEIAECDKPTGHMARVKFLYEEIGSVDTHADAATRKQQLAAIITGKQNGRLPRTIVNRFWQRFMGFGLVESVDEMDKPAWSPELLDWLAEDLVAHGFNLKHTMERILTSRAYELAAVDLGETVEKFVFRGPGVRRLSAEQFSDALMTIGDMNYPKADAKLNRLAALNEGAADALPLLPRWIWSTPNAHLKAKPASVTFRRVVVLDEVPTEASLTITADNIYTVVINEKPAASLGRSNSTSAESYNIKAHVKLGANTVAVTVVNLPPNETKLGTEEFGPEADNPAGLILYARLRAPGRVMDFVSDQSWSAGKDKEPAVELGDVHLAPWKIGRTFLELAAAPTDSLPVQRASLVAANPLMAALGRPNREQIMTVRQDTATTLQALELTNGVTLSTLLQRAAKNVVAAHDSGSRDLVAAVYRQTLSRDPSPVEIDLAQRVVGSPADVDGVEDLLWGLTMLPEFQLIH